MTKTFGQLALLLSLVACQQSPQSVSQSKIINGTMGWFNEQPAVVPLYDSVNDSICTGTFISDSEVLTAAHCTQAFPTKASGDLDGQLYLLQINDIASRDVKVLATSTQIFRDPRWEAVGAGVNRYDLAIVRFPKGTWGTQGKISQRPAEAGDPVEMFGYGLNQDVDPEDKSSVGVFRKGYNRIDEVEDGFLVFQGKAYTGFAGGDGEFASPGHGDSGGPLFVNGEIVGIVSGGMSPKNDKETTINYYVDLHSSDSQKFLSIILHH